MQLRHGCQRTGAVRGFSDDLVPLRLEQFPGTCPKAGVVVDDQNSHRHILAAESEALHTASRTLSLPLSGAGGRLLTGLGPRSAGGKGDLDVEDRSPAVVRFDPEPAFDSPHQLPTDVQPEAGPADPAGHVGIDAVELLEDPSPLGRRNPEAAVGDGKPKEAGGRLEPDADVAAVR